MSPRPQTRHKHLVSVGQPALTLLLTLCVAFFVAVPAFVSPEKASSTPTVSSSVVTRGSTIPLPGQGTPNGIELQAGPGTPAGDSRVVRMKLGGRDRGYLLLPAVGLPAGASSALLVVLHQDVGSARAVAQGLGLDALRRHGVALAYPAGVSGSWNAGTCCGQAKLQGVDDVAFVDQVFTDVGRRLKIDPRRRALLGYSGGGMLTYRVLCQGHSDLVAAVEVSGSLEASCPSNVTLPDMLSIHGALDGTIGLSKPIRVTRLGITPRTVLSTLSTMTWLAGCGHRTSRDLDGVRHLHWTACRGGSTLDVQIVSGAGHGWDDIGAAERAMPFLVQRLTRRA
jgi:polyhydroxybutyrate depolymerase